MDFEEIKQLAIYKKANEILKLTYAIVESIDDEADTIGIKGILLDHALTLCGKVTNASAGGDYSRSMEMAVLVKIAACELKVQSNWLSMEKMTDPAYITLLREHVDDFKPLFVEWVKTFDLNEDYNDGWLWITAPIKDDEQYNKDNPDGFNIDDIDFDSDEKLEKQIKMEIEQLRAEYGNLFKTWASFGIGSNEVSLEIITSELNIEPDHTRIKGGEYTAKNTGRKSIRPRNVWTKLSQPIISESDDISDHINYFRKLFADHMDVLYRYKTDPLCDVIINFNIETEGMAADFFITADDMHFLNSIADYIQFYVIKRDRVAETIDY